MNHPASLSLLLGLLVAQATAAASPSLVLVTLDTTRADRLSPYGDERAATPTLQRLATDGFLFERAFATTPVTLPSHASILTGLNPTRHAIRDNGIHYLSDDLPTLATLLQRAGYHNAAFVSAAVLEARYGLDRGFEHYDDDLSRGKPKALRMVAERSAQVTVDAAVEWLDGADRRPFLLWVHLFDPHAGYEPPPPFDARFAERPYDGEIAYMDQELGRLLQHPRVALPSEVVVMVIGDHGESLGEHGEATHGMLAYDATLHVPWIVRAPGGMAGGRTAEPVSQVDLLPTALELLGLPDLASSLEVDGRSLAHEVLGERGAEAAPPLYAETFVPYYAYGWAQLRTLRQGGWKLIEAPTPELYHTTSDPDERRNLYPVERERAARLAARLEELALLERTPQERPSVDRETAAQLESLGYVVGGSAAERAGPRPDPKEMIGLHETMGRAKQLLLERRFEAAIAAFEAVLREDPSNLDALVSLARARGETGDLEAALETLRRALELAPERADLHLTLAGLERSRGRLQEAARAVQRALELDPHSVDAGIERARILARQGEQERAAAELRRWLAEAPGLPRLQVLFAELVELPSRRFADAEARLRRAVEREPFLVEGWLALARVLERQARRGEAVESLRRALSFQPLDRRLLAELGRLLVETVETGAPGSSEGSDLLRRALERPGPPLPEARIALAEAYTAAGRPSAARQQYRALLEEVESPSHERAVALFQLGEREAAAGEWRAALARDPEEARAHDGLSNVALVGGDFAAAEAAARRATELDPALASAWSNLAVALEELGRPEEALSAYRRALEADPALWSGRFNYGLLLRRLERWEEAAAAFEKVLEQVPGHAKSHYELGVIYGGALGRPAEARRHLEACLAAEPDHPRSELVRRMLAQLEASAP